MPHRYKLRPINLAILTIDKAFFFPISQLKAEEVSGIMNDFEEPGHLAPTGLFLGGTKYMVIQGEPGAVIRGKKVPISSCLFFSFFCSIHIIGGSLK